MTGFFWLGLIVLPLALALLLLDAGKRWRPLIWLAPLPALWLAWQPARELSLGFLWPDARWGLQHDLAGNWLGFTALLWLCAGLYAWYNHKDDPHARRFQAFWLLTLTGNLLLLIALDAISFYIGFTLMSLSAYGLIIHKGGPEPIQAGRLYVQLAVLGEMLIYAALMLRIQEAGGSLLLSKWQQIPTSPLTASLLLVGFGIKAGFFPLHIWLPLAHPAAPPAASAVLSGAMIKAGILGLWRFLPEADASLVGWSPVLVALGLVSAFYGVVLGLLQKRVKTALAYSSISQIGYLLMVLGLALGTEQSISVWVGVLALYGVHHGLAKGALFMGAGLAMTVKLPRAAWVLMTLPALALAGLPFTGGAVAKTALKTGLYDSDLTLLITLLSLGSLATTLLVIRIMVLMRQANQAVADDNPMPVSYWFSWGLLALTPVLLPWLWPLFIDNRSKAFAADALMDQMSPILLAFILYGIVSRLMAGRSLPDPGLVFSRKLSLYFKRKLQPVTGSKKPLKGPARAVPPPVARWQNRADSVTLASALLAVLLFLLIRWLV